MEPDIDKIEAYVTGSMTGTERQAFEAEMAANEALAEEVEAFRLAREAIELSIGDQLRAQFSEWGEADAAGTKTEEAKVVPLAPRRNLRRILTLAASVLLILAVGSLWYVNDRYAADQIAFNYYETVSLDISRTGSGAERPLAEGIQALQAGEYDAAEAYFQNIPSNDENYPDARYYLGHSLYRQGKSAAAIEVLNGLNNTANPNLQEAAAWLKVLCYLRMGQTDTADFQSLLSEMLADPGHSYHQQAVDLNERLNSFWYQLAN